MRKKFTRGMRRARRARRARQSQQAVAQRLRSRKRTSSTTHACLRRCWTLSGSPTPCSTSRCSHIPWSWALRLRQRLPAKRKMLMSLNLPASARAGVAWAVAGGAVASAPKGTARMRLRHHQRPYLPTRTC